ncbi:oxidoreductase [Petrotoga mexicana DSM 14811]|uniref:Oxidoreductase n=1 Tax=Petrotoga mexicana DSM 14811 TaxID=1122954 RepID=A0A2K1PDJ2_9BACT|nr:Gfo/Idh/MocA family oxidoreductase [Petrotoga mexicana]PNS00883.1 oxidoreductase [Petrotoga mexicana DSM 14811]
MSKKITYGMVGGSIDSMIGEAHRNAILSDGRASIVSGCFSRDYKKTLKTGKKWGIKKDRLYENYLEMAEEESKKKNKIDFVVIATPNAFHYEIAKAFLEKGINVVCDKPLTTTVKEAEELKQLADDNDLLVCVTYSYVGYPVVSLARNKIEKGKLGEIRFVNVQYIQGWLAKKIEDENKQAQWRLDPNQSGLANTTADIGSHVENMVSYLTGKEIDSLCARLDTFGESRKLEDNSTVMINFKDKSKGLLFMSQIAVGENNNFSLSVFGSEATLKWSFNQANKLTILREDQKEEIVQNVNEIPGTNIGFKNTYSMFITDLINKKNGEIITNDNAHFQSVNAGLRGMSFIEKCVESSKNGSVWVKF